MAPYTILLLGMTHEQKQIVMTYISEAMNEPAVVAKGNAEIVCENLKRLIILPKIARLRGCKKLTESEKQSERTRYILGL